MSDSELDPSERCNFTYGDGLQCRSRLKNSGTPYCSTHVAPALRERDEAKTRPPGAPPLETRDTHFTREIAPAPRRLPTSLWKKSVYTKKAIVFLTITILAPASQGGRPVAVAVAQAAEAHAVAEAAALAWARLAPRKSVMVGHPPQTLPLLLLCTLTMV